MFRQKIVAVFLSVMAGTAQAEADVRDRLFAIEELCTQTQSCDGILDTEVKEDRSTTFTVVNDFCLSGGLGENSPFCNGAVPSLACIIGIGTCDASLSPAGDSSCHISDDLTGWCCFDSVQDIEVCGVW